MNEDTIISIASNTMVIMAEVSAPMLVVALLMGIIVSIFQAATQINEQTLSFIPKITAMFAAAIVCGPWIIQKMMDFTILMFQEIGTLSR